MPTRCNKHIKKFNQLVEVYDPTGIESFETVDSRDQLDTYERKIRDKRKAVEQLGVAEFFDDQRRDEIRQTESLPEPAAVADDQREEMIERLDLLEEALSEATGDGEFLDTTDDIG